MLGPAWGLHPGDVGHGEGSGQAAPVSTGEMLLPRGYRGKVRAELGEGIVNAPLLQILRDKSFPGQVPK